MVIKGKKMHIGMDNDQCQIMILAMFGLYCCVAEKQESVRKTLGHVGKCLDNWGAWTCKDVWTCKGGLVRKDREEKEGNRKDRK